MPVAIGIFRGLSGCRNYPKEEGEARRAKILQDLCDGPTHAKLVIAEFDDAEDCPTPEALRCAALRLAEMCVCGKPKWQHREGTAACSGFSTPTGAEKWEKTAEGYSMVRQSVPMIPGVTWVVALQVETIRIDLGHRSLPADHARLQLDMKRFPEATTALYEKREPDYALLESQMRKLFPWMWKRATGSSSSEELRTVSDRLRDIDKAYAVESIVPEKIG